MRGKYGITEECCPWTSQKTKHLLGADTPPRVKACLDIAFTDRLLNRKEDQRLDDLMRDFFCDTSQAVQLRKWGNVETLNRGTNTSALPCLDC